MSPEYNNDRLLKKIKRDNPYDYKARDIAGYSQSLEVNNKVGDC
jgi:hypothetical protein